MEEDKIRFEGSSGIYKVFVRQGSSFVYERTISIGCSYRGKRKMDMLKAAYDQAVCCDQFNEFSHQERERT